MSQTRFQNESFTRRHYDCLGKIHTVLLDMDGTLLDLHYDNHFWLEHVPRRYAEKNALTPEAAKNELSRPL